jgi:hypothetical protein
VNRLFVLSSLAVVAAAQLPQFYGKVDRVIFVVPDVEKSLSAWKASGAVEIFEVQEATFFAEYKGTRGESAVRFGVGRFGDVIANWMQPVSGSNAFSDFLESHGPGVFALLHRVSGATEFSGEIERMKRLGVGVLQQGSMGGPDARYAFFDTRSAGKYTLGIYYGLPPAPPPPPLAPKVTQFAFIANDEEPVAAFWERLGWPRMNVTHPRLHALRYQGQEADFKARLGWMRHGSVPYEWVIPEKGPSTWHDHLRRHGEGVHHLAFAVDDIDRSIAEWTKAGFRLAMSGAWGEPGKSGYGRFAYLDCQAAGGIDIELLWSYK